MYLKDLAMDNAVQTGNFGQFSLIFDLERVPHGVLNTEIYVIILALEA